MPLAELELERARETGFVAAVMHTLGQVYLMAGRLDEAAQHAKSAVDRARQKSERAREAMALSLLGDVARHCNPPQVDQAEDHYRRAMALAEPRGMRPLVAHCHLGLGQLYRDTGKREQAREQLATAGTMYREMGMTFWLAKAGAVLKAPQ